jgi:glycosyltransferase involved in cell wall biosynthesis
MNKYLISIIVPTYKPKDYLYECLEAIAHQSMSSSKYEIILVLNGCCEPWKSEIENYLRLNMAGMNIKFIQTDIGGVSNARNIALDCAEGEYVTFIDDDDYVSPRYLELLYKKAAVNTVVLSRPFAFNDGDPTQSVPYPMMDIYDEMHDKTNICISSKVRKYFSGPCMKLIPMSFIQERRYDVRFKNGEDSLFMFLISDRIKDIKFAEREAVYYRRYRIGSAVTSKRSRCEIIRNGMLQIRVYFGYFFMRPFAYNWAFFCTRIMATFKHTVINCL